MHNVNRNRANAQDKARRRHGPSPLEDASWRGGDGSSNTTQSIDLNHATCDQLEEIDGMSAYEARAIVAQRTLHGHFLGWEDLKRRVPGLDEECMHELQLSARIGSPRVPS
jgi:hypothetical protein